MPGRRLTRITYLVLFIAALLYCMPAFADVTGRPHDLSLTNPKGHCINCHDPHQVKLGQGYAHTLKRANEIAVCYQCHAGSLNNYSSIDPSYPNYTTLYSHYDIRSEFGQPHIHFPRYGMDGEHNKCSYCHNPHGVFNSNSTSRKPKLLSAGPDAVTDTDDFCLVCHNSDANPPHQPFSNISVRPQYRFSRTIYRQMRHSTFFRWSTANEPVPDTARTYDDNPYGKGKDISCLTCHRPHGSANDHMLKSADNQDFCLACHDGAPAADLTQFNTSGHGKAGVGRTCQECHFPHGTGQENAIKTLIVDSHTLKNMTANVTARGMNDACFACHSQGSAPTAYYSFDASISGWYSSVSYLTQSRDTAAFYSGGGSLKQLTSTSYSSSYSYTDYINVQPGTAYKFYGSLFIPATVTGGAVFVQIQEVNSSGSAVAYTTSSQWSAATGIWNRKSLSFTTNASTNRLRIYLFLTGTGTAYWDEISILGPSDGTSYPGKANYNLGIHKTSPNAHNPNDTTGDQAAGECDNCHNPHGKGNSKMLVDPNDQTLCYDCHNAATHNTQSGVDVSAAFQSASHHDLTKVKCTNCHNVHLATQASQTMDPFYPGGAITDKTSFCLSCHSGTMPAGATGAPDISAQWGGGGHNKTATLTCSDCHESHGSPNPSTLNYQPKVSGGYTANFASGMSLASRAFCEACHNRTGTGYKGAKKIPTGTGYVGQHDQSDPTACSNCHTKKHNPTISSYTGTASFYSTACLACHTQGQGNPYPNADAEFNTPANGADADTRKSIHDLTYTPPTRVDCVKCHGANHETDHSASGMVVDPDPTHGASGPMPSVAASSVFCLECHDSTPIKLSNYSSPVNIMDTWTSAGHGKKSVSGVVCEGCHTHHGSVNKKLIRTTINGSNVMSVYSGDNVSVCTACHKSRVSDLPAWPGYSVYSGSIHAFGNPTTGNLVTDGGHGAGVCVNCHNPHGTRGSDGKTVPSMAYKNGENLCYRCHASGFDNFSTPGDYNNKWDRFGSFLNVAKENDTAQTGQNKKALHLGVAGGQSVPNMNGGIYYEGLLSSNAFKDMSGAVASVKVKIPVQSQTSGYLRPGTVSIEDASNPPRPWPSTNIPPYVLCTFNLSSWVVWASSGTPPIDTYIGGVTGDRTAYHTVKFVRSNPSAGKVYVYMDSTFITSAPFAPKSGYFKVRLYAYGSTTATGSSMEAWFDDFGVQYPGGGSPARNTSSGDDVQARFQMATHHKISDADQSDGSKVECTDCHDPHTITERLMAFKNISDAGGRRVAPEAADQDFCLKCHSASPPAGVAFPAGGVWDKSAYDSSAHGNQFKRIKGFGNYSNNVTYPCKVCHNPHGSNQAALERESWDINRDGIPDDIDGDGILDSSYQVGFIGYSAGTRKVILVSKMAGIPSRASFKRISTTIPVQANGAIDVMLCLNCHDGTPAPDVKKDFDKVSHHDVTYADQVADGGTKIECYNCHDQHRAQARNDAAGEYPTTNPKGNREPMPGDAPFCLKCHDNNPPSTVSFGSLQLKNIKLSYNPGNLLDANGYDIITSYQGHFVQSTGKALMCRECHNQHGSNYEKMLRDDTEPSKPGYDSTQPVQNMQPVALRTSDSFSGGDSLPLTSTAERCLACHSGGATFEGRLLPIPPPPDAPERGFTGSAVGKHPDLKPEVTSADETGGHIYKSTFAVITTPGSVKESCTQCHDSHSPYIPTVSGQLMDCYRCHNQNTSLPDVQSEFNDNPTNPTRSQSMHHIVYNPTGTTPYYVECLKCHDQTKHMQGRVRLRKDPTQFINYTSDAKVWVSQQTTGGRVDNTLPFTNNSSMNRFCLECHQQGSAVAANFNRGGAHVPPKLPSGHLSGAHLMNGGLVCTSCHEYHGSTNKGLRKNARGDSETFCYSCHSSPANSKDGINIQAKFAQTSRHQVSQADQTANKSKVECEDCHNPHVVTRENMVVRMPNVTTAAPSDNAFCIGCHDANGAPGVRFPGYTTGVSAPEWDTATGKWNKWDKSAYTGSGHDAKGFLCKKCHDPHGSPNYTLLLQNISTTSNISVSFGVHSTSRGKRREELGVNRVCAACHKKPVGVYNFANYSVGSYPGYATYTSLTFGRKYGVDKNCTYCHNPHGTTQPRMIRSSKTLYMNMTSKSFGNVYNFKGFSNSTTGKPYYAFCSSQGCHASERTQLDTFNEELPVDNFTKDETASSHHPIKEGVIGCTSCHREHGSGYAPDLRAPYFREKNWPTLFHAGRGVYSVYHRPYVGDPFDGSNYYELSTSPPGWPPDATHRNQVTTVNPPTNANDLCYMCHQMDDIIGTASNGMTGANTKFIGHEAVKGGATISRNISRDTNWIGTDGHNFSCSMCHFPHSSSRGKLLKTGCMSQADSTQDPNSSYGTINSCHSYKKVWYGSTYRGWRNLTTAGKNDFRRPPNAVTNLSISSDPDLAVHLSWTAVADAPGQGAHHYNVYRYSQAITQDLKPYATRISNRTVTGGSPGSAMSYNDLTGQPNTTYYYAVVACDSENNESFVSNPVNVSLGADTYAPAAISDQATAQVDGTYNVKAAWHDPGDNVNVTQYKVYRKSGLTALTDGDIISGNYLAAVTDTSLSADGSPDVNAYSYTDTTAQFGNSYSYAVVALDAAGNVSHVPTGSTFSVTVVDPAPAAVTTLTARPVSLQMQAQLTWTAPVNVGSISGYNVYRKAGSALIQSDLVPGNLVNTGLVTGLGYVDNVPSTATDYYYTVTAVDQSSGKESLLGNCVSVNLPAPPAAVSATMQKNSVAQVSWTAPAYMTGFTGYKVYTQRGAGSWTQAALADNLAPNPGFEYDVSSWTAYSLEAARDTSKYYDGVASVMLVGSAAGDKYLQSSYQPAVLPSTSYTYSGYVNVPVALTGGTTALRVIEYNASGGYVTEHTATGVSSTSGWQKLTDTWTTSATTAKVYLRLQLSGAGTVNWDGLSLTSPVTGATSAKVNLSGLEPGSYSIAVTATYNTYAGVTPYESAMPAPASLSVTDTAAPAAMTVTGALTQSSGYNNAGLNWTSPADQNYSGYTPSGLAYYTIRASYDLGNTWNTIIRSRLSNPNFEVSSGTIDDANTDSFTGWTNNYTNMYCVSDSLFDARAIKIRFTGTPTQYTTNGYGYIYSSEPAGASVANRTYSMSFWAKATKATTFQYYLKAGTETVGSSTPSIGTGWQRFTTSGTFGSGNSATYASAYIRPSSDTTADIVVDGVRLDTGTTALQANDGTYLQPTNYNVPGSAQSFDDPNALTAGTAARYIIQTCDTENNSASLMADYVSARPAQVTDLTVTSSASTSANVLTFSTPSSAAGISGYMVYAKEQASALSSLTGATLLTPTPITPNMTSGGNLSTRQATVASANYANMPASLAKDGNASTYWEGRYGYTNLLTLDLGSAISVNRVSFSFDSQTYLQPSNYTVQTSNDNTNWTTWVTVTGNTSQYPSHTFTAVSARYIRLSITELRGGIAYYSPRVYEFAVYPGMNEQYVHDSQNLALPALVGHTYSYAVIPVDASGFSADISSGPTTYRAVLDKDGPQKVTDLAVTSPIHTDQAILSWSTPPDNNGLGVDTGATVYQVYRVPLSSTGTAEPVTDDNFSDISKAQLCYSGTYASSQAGTFNNYTATWYDHTAAYYGVRSGDGAGNWSRISNSPFVMVGKDSQAPTPPTIWSCAPAASPEVDVKWYAAVDNVGINGYMLFRADTTVEPFATDKCITENNISLATTVYGALPYNYTIIADTGGTPGKTYYYAMRAFDDEGNVSNISNCATATVATTAADTTAPTWSGTPLSVYQQPWPDMDLIWTAASDLDNSGGAGTIDHYDIYRSSASFSSTTDPGVTKIATVSGLKTSYVDNTGDHGTYYYAVVAVDAAASHNQSAISNVATGTYAAKPSPDNTPPTVPTGLNAATGIYPFINLSWTASTDVDDSSTSQQLLCYKLYRSDYPRDITDANKGNSALVKTFVMANNAVSYSATGMGGTTYNYRLEAFDLAGNGSGLSSQVTATEAPAPCVDNTAPSEPWGLAIRVGPSPDMELTWGPSADTGCPSVSVIDHYNLYRANYAITASTDLRTLTPVRISGDIAAYTNLVVNSGFETDTAGWTATGLTATRDTVTVYKGTGSVKLVGAADGSKYLESADYITVSPSSSYTYAGYIDIPVALTGTTPTASFKVEEYDSSGALVGERTSGALSSTSGWLRLADSWVTGSSTAKVKLRLQLTGIGTVYWDEIGLAASRTYTDSSGAPNTQYWYVMTGVDPAGNESVKSNIIVNTTAADTMAPAAVSDLKATAASGKIVLTWCRPSDNVSVAHYDIYRKEQGTILTDADITPTNKLTTFTNGGVCLSYNDTGVVSGHTYSYAVIAVDGSGNRSTISRGLASGDTIAAMP